MCLKVWEVRIKALEEQLELFKSFISKKAQPITVEDARIVEGSNTMVEKHEAGLNQIQADVPPDRPVSSLPELL